MDSLILFPFKIYMLFAGWEVCMVKNCDRGLENHADPNPSSYNLESTFKSMGHIFFIHKLAILIFFLNWLEILN